MLLRASRVVLLSRKNLLAVAVSATIAERRRSRPTGNGAPIDAAEGPLDVARVGWMLSSIQSSLRTHRRVLYTRDRPCIDITAEPIFGASADTAARMAAVEEVFAFFGRGTGDEGVDLDRIRRGLAAAVSGPDSAISWQELPNVEEIEQRLGSDEAGWLLRGGAA